MTVNTARLHVQHCDEEEAEEDTVREKAPDEWLVDATTVAAVPRLVAAAAGRCTSGPP